MTSRLQQLTDQACRTDDSDGAARPLSFAY